MPTKVCLVKAMAFPVVKYGCENCTINKAKGQRIDVWTVVLEKTLESPLDCKEIQRVYLKGNQSWIFIGRTDAEAEISILWPPDAKNWLIRKDPDTGWERLNAGGEGDDRGWDGWMASLMWWTWVWVGSRSGWWTGKPVLLQSMGLQWVRLRNWTELILKI